MISVAWDVMKEFSISRKSKLHYFVDGGLYRVFSHDGPICLTCLIAISQPANEEQLDFETNYKAGANQPEGNVISSVPEPLPFAQPTYSTKREATADIITVTPNSSVNVDFHMLEERYVTGGAVIIENAELGDYVVAQVRDDNAVIPELYRALLCEAWPVVATYLIKQFVELSAAGSVAPGSISVNRVDTYPLNAKITAGLILRVEYHAVNSGLNRRIGVNYNLTKKI